MCSRGFLYDITLEKMCVPFVWVGGGVFFLFGLAWVAGFHFWSPPLNFYFPFSFSGKRHVYGRGRWIKSGNWLLRGEKGRKKDNSIVKRETKSCCWKKRSIRFILVQKGIAWLPSWVEISYFCDGGGRIRFFWRAEHTPFSRTKQHKKGVN